MSTETTATIGQFATTLGDVEPSQITVTLAPEVAADVQRLMTESGESLSDVFRKSLALYLIASEAHRQGKAVGAASSADVLEEEYTGF